MIRTGGLPLPEVFNRVRLRVNEASKGAQVPWDSQKVDAAFTFFERAPDAPAAPPPDQVAAIRNKPIRDLGVQDAYAAVLERDTLPAYEEFLAAYPGDPMAKRVRAIAAARREAITWRRTYRADTPNAYWSYLRRYPHGPHAARRPPPACDSHRAARAAADFRCHRLRRAAAAAGGDRSMSTVRCWRSAIPSLISCRRHRRRSTSCRRRRPDFIVLEPPPPPIGLFILPQPHVRADPGLCAAAASTSAPPPNNIIFANIHNRAVIDNVINRPPPPMAPGGLELAAVGRRTPRPLAVAPAQVACATPTLPPPSRNGPR